MSEEGKERELTSISQPVAELPVADVERAQQYYCDALGFKVAWLWPAKSIGAVSRGEAAIFLRKAPLPFDSINLWIFTPQIEATRDELEGFGANIVEPLEKKSWGLMQFTFYRQRSTKNLRFAALNISTASAPFAAFTP